MEKTINKIGETLVPWVLVTRVLPTFLMLKIEGALMSYQSFLAKGSALKQKHQIQWKTNPTKIEKNLLIQIWNVNSRHWKSEIGAFGVKKLTPSSFLPFSPWKSSCSSWKAINKQTLDQKNEGNDRKLGRRHRERERATDPTAMVRR